MKKFYYSLFAAASMMLAVTSCSQEEELVPQSNEVTRFSVQLDGATQSRTAGDGKTVDKLYYAVYDKNTSKVIYPANAEYGTAVKGKDGWTLELPLMKSETYDILFWAQKDGSNAYTFDNLTEITVNYDGVLSNKEDRDAFFNALDNFTASGSDHIIVLRRPFAQLNVATTLTDWNKAKDIYNSNNGTTGIAPVAKSAVTVNSLATKFNVLTGAATEATSVSFGANELIDESIKIKLDGVETEYKLLAMNYLLPVVTKAPNGVNKYEAAEEAKDGVEVEFTLYKGGDEQIVNVKVPSTPIQRNWRTNIIGDLLTGEGFDIIVDAAFDNEVNQEIEISADGIVKDAEGIYHITKTEGLYSLAKLVNYGSIASEGRAAKDYYTFTGKTFVLDCDIDLQGEEWTPMDNFDGIFDGKGKTISNFKVKKANSAGLFGVPGVSAVIKNLTVTDATIAGNHYAGVIAGYGYVGIENCHVKNSTVTLTTEIINGEHDNGDKAGAIIGYLCEEGGTDYVKNCSAENVTIRGYRDIGGLVGIANGTAEVSGNTITNSIIVIDKTNNYKNYATDEEFHGGAVVGEISTSATVKDNTDTDVEITYIGGENYKGYYVDANNNIVATESKGITEAIKEGATTINLSEGSFNLPSLAENEGITLVGTGATVIGGDNSSTGFDSNFGKNTTIKNVTFSGTTNGVRWSYAQGGDTTFDNCTFAGGSTYGFHIDESKGANFIFNNCTFSGFNAFAGDLSSVIFNNCTFKNNGSYGHTNIWSVAYFNNCIWEDNTSVSPAGSGKLYFNENEESYHHEFIGSAENLFAFAKSVNEGGDSWRGQAVILVNDIDLDNALWTPVGQTGATQFNGTFDGNNYTISNLNINSEDKDDDGNYASGLFGWTETGTIKNVKIDGVTVVGGHLCAAVIGYVSGSVKITGCSVNKASITCKELDENDTDPEGDKAACIVGQVGGGIAGEITVSDCHATNSTISAGRDAGQIVGAATSGCAVYVDVNSCSAQNVSVTSNGTSTGNNVNEQVIGRM